MADNVIPWEGITRLDTDPSRVIEAAAKVDFEHVVIIGFCAGGSEYFASSQADGGSVLWHLERAKHKLMLIADD